MNAWAPLLLPFSLLYGSVTACRNLLFDTNFLHRKQFPLPVIGVGNLSVGGTGKTPHIEYLIRLLKNDYRVATISRGYGRRTRGFLLAEASHDHTHIGDEPLQYLAKFKDVVVSVDSRRNRGIKKLLTLKPKTQVILMDDSFQHRWTEPGLNILLTDFRNLYINDYILPAGTLRESVAGARRADIIVVTKTDPVFPKMLRQHITEEIKPQPHQKLLFSTISYGKLDPLTKAAASFKMPHHPNTILLVAGIANPYPLQDYLRKQCENVETLRFKDHHNYSTGDVHLIESSFRNILSKNKIIVTTEKDAMRLRHPSLAPLLERLPVFSIGIEVVFHDSDKAVFDDEVRSYVKRTLKGNR